ncbi:MAG: COG1361 S-layer family protein [Nitrososphaerales archaeon]
MKNARRNPLVLSLLAVIVPLFIGYSPVSAAQTSFWDANIHVDVTHPNTVTYESRFSLSSVLRGKTADNVNVTVSLTPSAAFKILDNNSFYIPKLQQDSTLGFTFELETTTDVTEGTHAINFFVTYEHKELLGDYTKQSFSKAIEIQLKSLPEIVYSIQAADSLFVGDKFTVKVVLQNIGTDAHDVKVNIIPPNDLAIIGQNTHTLSKLEAGDKFDFEFELEVAEGVDKAENKLLQVKASYLDAGKDQHESTETFPLFVRPRGFLEVGAAGGVWIGPVFISLITGIGSIVSASVGFMYFIYRVKQKRRTADRKIKRQKS